MKLNMRLVGRAALMAVALTSLAGCAKLGLGGGDKKPKTPTIGQRIAILTSEASVEVDPSLADVAVLLPPAAVNDAWSQPGGNGAKSMEHPALGNALGVAWDVKIAGSSKQVRLAAAPVVSGGRLYVMDTQARVHALDTRNGGQVWVADLGTKGEGGKASWGGGVSVDGDIVYATTGLGDVVAMKADTGAVVWKKRPGGPLRGSPSLGNGNVYVLSSDNQLFALSAADGSTQWTEAGASELAGVFGVAAPAVAQGTVVAGFSSGELNAYRYENGRALWADALTRTSISTSVSSLSDIDASPVIDRGRVFAVGKGGRMVSMELVTGQRLWEINLAGIETPWVAGEWLFVVSDDARLLCISRGNGKVRWVTQLQRYKKEKKKVNPINWVGPILAGDRLILANSEGALINVSPADGKIQSTTKAGGSVFLPPIVTNNSLYILTNEGRLVAWR
jgi:outer membrane protein assembly factor BamB